MQDSDQHDHRADADAVAPVEDEQPERTPLYRRYTIAVNADVNLGAVPTGRPPIGY